jgi:hypothetical protein
VDGDIWITAIGQQFVWRSQGTTFSAVDASSQQSIAGLKTFTTRTTFAAGTTSNASMRVPHGVAPTTPTNGDIWTTTAGLYVRVNGATVGPLAAATADPPADGKLYARKGATWDEITDDFATKADLSYVAANYLNLTGGALSGQLIIDYPAVGTKLTVGGNGAGIVNAQISNLSTGVSAGSRLTISTGIDYSNILMDLSNTGAGSVFQILAGAGVTGGIDISAVKVTGPTPTAGDNSTKFATTAFVAGALVPLAPLAGATFTGKVNIKPSDAGSAYFNISTGTGVPPSAPVQGDMWATGSVLGFQGQSITYSVAFLNSTQSFTGTKTFTAQTFFKAGSTGSASINMPHGAAPTTPVDGDVWTTTTGVFARINGATQQVSPGWVQMTQAAYDALGTKDPNMLYVIFG